MKTLLQFLLLDTATVEAWFESNKTHVLRSSIAITIIGTAVYGMTIGLWRGSLQAFYVAMKFPLLIFITTGCNSLLNWFISLMVGAHFSFIRTLKYQFISYAIASIILLSFAPISLFLLWNIPPLSGEAVIGNSLFTLTHVFLIAVAGSIANVRLLGLLRKDLNSKTLARMVLISWLAGNMFLGCQISWILRPFIGSPSLPIQFVRSNPLEGNFYIDVYAKFITIATHKGANEHE